MDVKVQVQVEGDVNDADVEAEGKQTTRRPRLEERWTMRIQQRWRQRWWVGWELKWKQMKWKLKRRRLKLSGS